MADRKKVKRLLKEIVIELNSVGYLPYDYRTYILPLIYLNWLLRLDAEQVEERKELPISLRGHLKSDWEDVEAAVRRKIGIGNSLSKVFLTIEGSDNQMKGILINPDANQWENASDKLLELIVRKLSSLCPDIFSLKNSELLSEVCEELLVTDLELHQSRKGERFFTPTSLGELVIQLVDLKSEMRVCDPICGSGSILIEAARYIRSKKEHIDRVHLYGMEKNYEMRMTAAIILSLFKAVNSYVLGETGFSSNSLETERSSKKFNAVLFNPPFGVKNWMNRSSIQENFEYGDPPKNSADYVFIQRALSMLDACGKAVVIVPHGVLFRSGSEGKIRERIVKEDLIEAVISLPSNLFHMTSIPTAILVFNKAKLKDRKQKIIFIDASREYSSDKRVNNLSVDNIDKIASTYYEFEEKSGYSKVVSQDEISACEYLLTISRYVETERARHIDIEAQISRMLKLESKRSKLEADMDNCLKALGLMN